MEDDVERATMLFLTLVFVCSSSLSAQQSPIQIGVIAGAAITTLVGSDMDDAEMRTSPQFGALFVLHQPSSIIGFQTGASYVPKGATSSVPGAKGALEVAYIEVPLLLRIGLPLQGVSVMPVLAVGGSLGLKTSCNFTVRSGGISGKIGCDDSLWKGDLDLKTVDLGISGAASVDIPVGARFVLSPSAQYTHGLSNIWDTSDNADAKNSAIQVGMAVRVRM